QQRGEGGRVDGRRARDGFFVAAATLYVGCDTRPRPQSAKADFVLFQRWVSNPSFAQPIVVPTI
ncbi:MAG TPA: hypothetical protein VM890_04245, partial [Longimicrobium sp.]|nr:hypothetical protein [Longimicrobium sp.]